MNQGGMELISMGNRDVGSGPADTFTVHGLFVDRCDGTFPSDCDPSRAYPDIEQILLAAGQQDLVDFIKYVLSSESHEG